jgi:hypothetical protein
LRRNYPRGAPIQNALVIKTSRNNMNAHNLVSCFLTRLAGRTHVSLVLGAIVLVSQLSVPVARAGQEFSSAGQLLGTWRFQQRQLLGSFEGYTTYLPNGRCKQIMKIRGLGGTKIIVSTSTWRVVSDTLIQTIVTDDSSTAKPGTEMTSRILSLTDRQFIYKGPDGKKCTEDKVSNVPASFLIPNK